MPYCPKCGAEVSEDMAFCPGCGASLKAEKPGMEAVTPV
ncbi:MAG: zinc ribbon domain-containing protein, partial [Candidatus Korarchaeota archaeon]|nr:zinc ribbon domain-containing protein [Candidatus Korarchaeota archaeon]